MSSRWGKRRWTFDRTGPVAGSHAATPRSKGSAPARTPARLLLLNQYYWPDHASTAQHLTDLAESLCERGYEVHVLCSRGGYKAGSAALPRRETRNGVQIHRVGATSLGRHSTWRRLLDYLSFYMMALLAALWLPRFDLVVTLTTPPLIALVGTLLRRLRGTRHVYWSMDLHPDASLALGRMNARNPVVKALAALARLAYRQADHVVALGPYMADRLALKGVRRGRMSVIPVWSRGDEIEPLPREGHALRAELGLADKFVVMYSGNLGLAHRFEEIIVAADRLRDRDDVGFLFVGGGPRLGEVEAARDRLGLGNITLMDYVPRERLAQSLSLGDAHLITLRAEMVGIVMPSKLYGILAAQRPVLFVGPDHCEPADVVQQARCGICVRPGDGAGLAAAITHLADDPAQRLLMGARGRDHFLRTYERDHGCSQWAALIADSVGAVRVPAAMASPALPSLATAPAFRRAWSSDQRVRRPERATL